MAKGEIVALSTEAVDVEYDEKADVLYILFGLDSQADDSELTDNDVVIRYRKDNWTNSVTLFRET